MANYEFELIFKLNKDEDPDGYLDALFEAGCDDASISTGEKGYIGLSFMREAETPVKAIVSALHDTKLAIPHAQLEKAEPYLLNLSELAFELGFSKQNMRKYARGEAAKTKDSFPRAFIQGKTSYWFYYEVAKWLKEEGIVDITNETINKLLSVFALNRAVEDCRKPQYKEKKQFEELLKCG